MSMVVDNLLNEILIQVNFEIFAQLYDDVVVLLYAYVQNLQQKHKIFVHDDRQEQYLMTYIYHVNWREKMHVVYIDVVDEKDDYIENFPNINDPI